MSKVCTVNVESKDLTTRRKYFGWLFKIHSAEMFPLIVSGAVVIQSIVVIPVQGLNASPILLDGCVRTVQLVWPGMEDVKCRGV